MTIAGLVLAAGAGSRLGRPKAEVVVGGRRLVDLAIESCVRAGLSPVVVVLGATWLTPMPLADSPDGEAPEVWLVENDDWATGMASSLRAGLAALEPEAGIEDGNRAGGDSPVVTGGIDAGAVDAVAIEAVVVTLVDTPTVGEKHLRRVGAALRGGATAAVATYEGTARTPVGLAREVWADVARTVVGDEGARGWLRAHSELVTEVECADLGRWTDIDTAEDLPD